MLCGEVSSCAVRDARYRMRVTECVCAGLGGGGLDACRWKPHMARSAPGAMVRLQLRATCLAGYGFDRHMFPNPDPIPSSFPLPEYRLPATLRYKLGMFFPIGPRLLETHFFN